jgi:hypothetical protein
MGRSPLALASLALVACVPCLLIPLTAALIAAGAFSGVLGLLGIPWVLALVAAIPVATALIVLRLRKSSPSCQLPSKSGIAPTVPRRSAMRLQPT